MKVDVFINNFREAFGEAAELPIVFWYSDKAVSGTEKINGCFFKGTSSHFNRFQIIALVIYFIGFGDLINKEFMIQ